MFLRFLAIMLLGFLVYRTVRKFLLGTTTKKSKPKEKVQNSDDFQQKHKNNIEDADFEELE